MVECAISDRERSLTSKLLSGGLPRACDKVKKRLAAHEALHEIEDQRRLCNQASLDTGRGHGFNVGVDAHNDLHIGRTLDHIGGSPLGGGVAQNRGGLLAACFAGAQEVGVEDYAVAVDEDENEGVAVLSRDRSVHCSSRPCVQG